MENTKQIELATKPVGRLLFKLSIPAILAQIINVLYNVVDRMYIGHIDNDIKQTAKKRRIDFSY